MGSGDHEPTGSKDKGEVTERQGLVSTLGLGRASPISAWAFPLLGNSGLAKALLPKDEKAGWGLRGPGDALDLSQLPCADFSVSPLQSR